MGDWGVIPRVFTLEVIGVFTLGQGRVLRAVRRTKKGAPAGLPDLAQLESVN